MKQQQAYLLVAKSYRKMGLHYKIFEFTLLFSICYIRCAAQSNGVYNVKDYGAIGNGQNDDTKVREHEHDFV